MFTWAQISKVSVTAAVHSVDRALYDLWPELPGLDSSSITSSYEEYKKYMQINIYK